MGKHKFTLGGEDFELDHADVERALEHVAPSEARKYYVVVHGRKYPVKQAISMTTSLPSDKFISTDAVRVLRNVGFKVERFGETVKPARTESELLFEEYLKAHALGYFDFEPEILGVSAKPDYRLSVQGAPVLFEVKEFQPDPALLVNMRGGAYDPYGRIREKIDAARKKFRDLETFCCCLVLHNCGHPLVDLTSWEIMYGAMLGSVGYSFPVDTRTGIGDPTKATRVFGRGGKMIRHKDEQGVEPQNRRLSAIVALDHLGLGMRRLSAYIDRIKADSRGEISVEEVIGIVDGSQGTERDPSRRQLRVTVYENPYAKIRLSQDIFRGEFDERYGPEGRKLQRIYAGRGILELEAEEARCDSHRGSPVLGALGRRHRKGESGEGASR